VSPKRGRASAVKLKRDVFIFWKQKLAGDIRYFSKILTMDTSCVKKSVVKI
jgi:hypothetical protein